jgi:hypothetical protein
MYYNAADTECITNITLWLVWSELFWCCTFRGLFPLPNYT